MVRNRDFEDVLDTRQQSFASDKPVNGPLVRWPQTRLAWLLRGIALLGLVQTWKSRYVIFSDGFPTWTLLTLTFGEIGPTPSMLIGVHYTPGS